MYPFAVFHSASEVPKHCLFKQWSLLEDLKKFHGFIYVRHTEKKTYLKLQIRKHVQSSCTLCQRWIGLKKNTTLENLEGQWVTLFWCKHLLENEVKIMHTITSK